MAISVVCPACNKKLKARDDLAGKRVKCPACQQPVLVPAMQPVATVQIDRTPAEGLIESAIAGDAAAIAAWIRRLDFTVAEAPEDAEGDDRAALVVEVNDFPAIVAFTSDDCARIYAESDPELLDADGSMPAFVVAGTDLLQHLPEEFGLLLNPESDQCAVLTPDLVEQVRGIADDLNRAETGGGESASDPAAQAVRNEVLSFLQERGFRPARWLPLPNLQATLRPAEEIAARLMGLAAVFTWASAPDEAVSSDKLRTYLKHNRLRAALTEEDVAILAKPRARARDEHAESIGWRLENMWPLAWLLGFEPEPEIAASQIEESISRAVLFDFLAGLDRGAEDLLQQSQPRTVSEIFRLEDLFYCAHHAVRSAQLGEPAVPDDFDPVVHGGAIHERRHALTWALSPGVPWDETDLST